MAIRNICGHRAGLIRTTKRALQHLELLSFVADRLDDTRRHEMALTRAMPPSGLEQLPA